MVTREQIERIEIGGSNDQWEMQGPIDKGHIVEILRLALVAIDGERDRKLGAAVLRLVADDSFDAYDLGVEVRAIAAALRGEP